MAQLRADFWAVCDPGWARWGQNRGEGDEVRGEDITPALFYSLPTHTINIGSAFHIIAQPAGLLK